MIMTMFNLFCSNPLLQSLLASSANPKNAKKKKKKAHKEMTSGMTTEAVAEAET
jgi:hypothetical protein